MIFISPSTACRKNDLRRSGYAFRADDKVMQIKNNYDKEVFNGDIGIIESVNENDESFCHASEESYIYRHNQSKEGVGHSRHKKTLAYAVKNVTVTKRNTLLKERLAG